MFFAPSCQSSRACPIHNRCGVGTVSSTGTACPAVFSETAFTTPTLAIERCSRSSEKSDPCLRTGPVSSKPYRCLPIDPLLVENGSRAFSQELPLVVNKAPWNALWPGLVYTFTCPPPKGGFRYSDENRSGFTSI